MNSSPRRRVSSPRSTLPRRFAAAVLLGSALWAAARCAAAEPVGAEPPPSLRLAVTHLSLNDAIALALEHNQRIKVTDLGRGIARANVLAEYGQFDPALTFSRSYSESELSFLTNLDVSQLTKTDNYALALEGATPWGMTYQIGGTAQNQRGTYNNFSNNYITFGGIAVTQPLLRGFGLGANLASLRIAKADRAIADWQYRQMVIDTVTNVIFAYLDLAEARQSLDIAEKSRDLARQLVSDNERRNRIGYIADADVTQARARAANREEGVLLARQAVQDAENRLRELTGGAGIAADGADILVDPLVPTLVPKPNGAADLERALQLRPDYQAARQGITKQRVNRALARNQLLPRVDFVGSFGYNGLDSNFARSRAQVRSEDNRAYSAGVVVSVPLTFAQGRGRARAAELSLRQSQADLVRLQQDIAVSLASAIGQLNTTAERVAATTKAYELARQALEAEQKRFRAGTSTTFVVLQLQEQLAGVQLSQVRAIADERRAIATYQRETGTTLLVHHLNVQ